MCALTTVDPPRLKLAVTAPFCKTHSPQPQPSSVDGTDRCPVTGISSGVSMARNVWIVVKPRGSRYDGDVLVTGAPFQLVCSPYLRIDEDTGSVLPPYYLCSGQKSLYRASKIRNLAEVSAQLSNDASTVFYARSVANGMYQAKGAPVTNDKEYVIVHKATGNALACASEYSYETHFGSESEICGTVTTKFNKRHLLVRAKVGDTTAQIPQKVRGWEARKRERERGSEKAEAPSSAGCIPNTVHSRFTITWIQTELHENHFSFVHSAEANADGTELKALSLEDIAKYLASVCESIGVTADTMAAAFGDVADAKKSTRLTKEEAFTVLRCLGLPSGTKTVLLLNALLGAEGFIEYNSIVDVIFPTVEEKGAAE